jgi:hypothetical protein
LHRSAWFIAWCASALMMLSLLSTLAPHLRNSAELVRMRNALLLQTEPASHQWTADERPVGFAVDNAETLVSYREAVSKRGLVVDGDDWATALSIGRHLFGSRLTSSTTCTSPMQRAELFRPSNCGAPIFVGLSFLWWCDFRRDDFLRKVADAR